MVGRKGLASKWDIRESLFAEMTFEFKEEEPVRRSFGRRMFWIEGVGSVMVLIRNLVDRVGKVTWR